MPRAATRPKPKSGSVSRPELFETPLEPDPGPPPEEPAELQRGPRERLIRWPRSMRPVRAAAVYAVLTEPDYAMAQWCLQQAVECLKPEQYQRLAAVLLELLTEPEPPGDGPKEVPDERSRDADDIPW